jgi:hypothetical protein
VSADELERAWQGISAMRFRAVRFFRTHQTAAMELVGSPSLQDRFIGGITSAIRIGDQWNMWHNSGPGLVDTLCSRCSWPDALCWLHGDGPQQRSLLVACLERPPRKLLWTGCITEIPEEFASRVPLQLISAERMPELKQILTDEISEHEGERSLVHCGVMDPLHFETFSSCQPSTACKLIVISESPGTRRRLSDQWSAGELHVLNQADIVVAEEAYDQTRWIGRQANLELLREAYEEYADF